MPPTLYIALALIFVIILRKFVPVVASSIGIALAVAIGIWAIAWYPYGTGITLFGALLPKQALLLLALVLLALESLNLWIAVKKKQRLASRD